MDGSSQCDWDIVEGLIPLCDGDMYAGFEFVEVVVDVLFFDLSVILIGNSLKAIHH